MGKKYIDERGWRYQVMEGLGTPPPYKARYRKPGSASWRCVAALPWRQTEEAAQGDLDDAQVASELCEKFWAEKPGIYIRISRWEAEHGQ